MLSLNQNNILIKATDITVAYGHRNIALADVSVDVCEGDFVAITGPNGGGKSTLLKTLLKLIKPDMGRVDYFWKGKDVDRLHIGYLPQKSNIDSRFPITVEEVVSSGLYGDRNNIFGKMPNEFYEKVDAMLDKMEIAELRRRPIGSLSGGQLQRTLLGRAIISEPDVVVLDEPLSYVDHHFIDQIYKLVEEISRRSTIILVSHEMTVISEMANRHWIVDHSLHECHSAHHFFKTCDE